MIEGLRPYAEMKATGIAWLPSIPAHWQAWRTKYLLREIDRRSAAGDETHLSMSQVHGLIPSRQSDQRRLVAESYARGKLVERGDLVLNRLKAHLGVFAHAPQSGVISPDYSVFHPRSETDVRYLEFVLKSPACRGELRTRTKGIVEGFWRLYTDDFYDIRLPRPPLEEQRLIVRFLDWHGAMTGRLIRAKRRLLELVAERRVALTEEVISSKGTREVRFRLAADRIFDLVSRDGDEGLTAVGLRNRGRGIFHKERRSGADLGDSTFSWIKAGDLILSGQFAWEGAIAVADVKDAGCIASHRYHIIRGKAGVENTYLWCFLRSRRGNLLLDEHSRGAAGRNRPLDALSLVKEKIPIPTHGEQLRLGKIVALEKQLTSIAEQYVGKLQEFRTRLIADVVTGHLDVRATAATLPDLTEELVADDLLDDTDPGEIADAGEGEEAAAA